jgi:hypothetical protein
MIDAATLKALGGGAGGALLPLVVMYQWAVPSSQFNRHVAEERTSTVQNLVDTLRNEPAGAYRNTLCKTLEATLAQICLDSPEHPFCIDRAVLMAKAGC